MTLERYEATIIHIYKFGILDGGVFRGHVDQLSLAWAYGRLSLPPVELTARTVMEARRRMIDALTDQNGFCHDDRSRIHLAESVILAAIESGQPATGTDYEPNPPHAKKPPQ